MIFRWLMELHVAGCAAAIGNNNTGLVGSGFRLTLMAVKVFPESFDTVIAAGVAYAIDNGADVINLSLGGYGGGELYVPVFREANERNIGIVCSAGNENTNIDIFPRVPVGVDGDGNWVTGVAATNNNDTKAEFSNYGTQHVDISAPGVTVLFHSAG